MADAPGIEPGLAVLETAVLPEHLAPVTLAVFLATMDQFCQVEVEEYPSKEKPEPETHRQREGDTKNSGSQVFQNRLLM